MGPKNTDYTTSYLNHHTAESVPFCVCRVRLIFDNTSSTNKKSYFVLLPKETSSTVLDYIRISFIIAGQTKFSPIGSFLKWPLHAYTQRCLHSSRTCLHMILSMQWWWFDDGKVGKKYSHFQVLDTS